MVGVVGALALDDGTDVIVDASTGIITVGPSVEQTEKAKATILERAQRAAVPIGPGALADGTHIPLLANLGSADGVDAALAAGAEGVGLFRTEFLFLDATSAPTVAQQYTHYSKLLRGFPGKKVVVRALDAGADKPLSFLNDAHEENPALGLRGLRALRASEQILRDQLTALARAAQESDADLWVMAPMVATVEETRYFVDIAHELGLADGRRHGRGPLVRSARRPHPRDRRLRQHRHQRPHPVHARGRPDARHASRASRIRGTPPCCASWARSASAGAALGKPVGICGEAAADPLLAVVLVGLGATSLSMSPPRSAMCAASSRASPSSRPAVRAGGAGR